MDADKLTQQIQFIIEIDKLKGVLRQTTLLDRSRQENSAEQPLLHNQHTNGGTWQLYGITLDRVLQRVAPIQSGLPSLWPFVQQVLSECVEAGLLMPCQVYQERSPSP